jgi:hypothetical protein
LKYLKYFALSLLGLMVLFGALGLLLPSAQHVERQIEIQAPATTIFPYVSDYRKFIEWSPWAKLDPKTHYLFSGPPSGVGAKMEWLSTHSSVGTGSQEILELQPNRFVKARLDFGDWSPALSSFSLSEVAGKTTLIWTYDTYMDNTISRYFGMMLDSWIGDVYKNGLSDLKILIESK